MRYQAALRPDCSTNTADKRKFKVNIDNKFLINLVLSAIRDPMIIECPNCNKKFNLDKKLIPENGRSLKCSNCDHIWHYKTQITKMILVYFIVVIVPLLGLIFLLDTFKSYLLSVFPNINPLFDSFYETLLDFKLFIKDLAN